MSIVGCAAYLSLLSLTTNMRMDFMKCLRGSPDDRDWKILTDHGMRIMQDATGRSHEARNICGYTSVVSFRIQAKPQLVFQYLVKKNRQLQVKGISTIAISQSISFFKMRTFPFSAVASAS